MKVIDDTATPVKYRFVFPAPYDERITKALSSALPIDEEAFDPAIRLIGEVLPVFLADFKPEFITDGKPDYVRIQKAILEMLQSETELTGLARKVRGEIKPIPTAGDLGTDRLRVLTQWQDLLREEDFRVYWRASIRLEKQAEGHWQLETLIDFGERLRSQSPEQIHKITDTNQLGAFETDFPDATTVRRVKYKPVTTAGQRVLSPEYRDHFGTMAPTLWNQVKAAILIRKAEGE